MTSKNSAFQTARLPGADQFPDWTLDKIEQRYTSLKKNYAPRTRHKNPDGSARFTNRLFLETSPYLLQHAHNPVNWYSWGDEAFETAKTLNRPILVSIGYSTCHWCHVMEEESFEDLEIAEYLNRHYICIKVDREERPDVDTVYMKAVQAITGNGGWPLNVMVKYDRRPFWGGTYFPARDGDRGSAFGFLSILHRIKNVYDQSPEEINKSCNQLTNAIERFIDSTPGTETPGLDLLDDAMEMYKSAFDHIDGGLQGAPKFPSNLPIRLLLRNYKRTGDKQLLKMVKTTLDKMADGGIYDQVGGGFHRYSTDIAWLVPHFEKMLYDNALLAVTYIEAHQVTGNKRYKEITEEILAYILREMSSPQGAFYSATDADSLDEDGHSEEGYFFTWTVPELEKVLNEKQMQLVRKTWSVTDTGNFEGRNILFLKEDRDRLAEMLNMPVADYMDEINAVKQILYQERKKRHHPLRDEKIIVSWNGMMISAFATAGRLLGKNKYVEAAVKAASYIRDNMIIDNRLHRTVKDDIVKHKAFLNDYANLIMASLDLFSATSDRQWLELALELDHFLESHFEDTENGGFYMTGSDQEVLLTREKPTTDGAMPSGNAVAMQNLLRLEALTLDQRYRDRFNKSLACFLGKETTGLAGYAEMLSALELSITAPVEIVIATGNDRSTAEPFLNELKKYYLPQVQVIVTSSVEPNNHWNEIVPFASDRKLINGKTTVYVCSQGSCQLPVTDLSAFAGQLEQLS